MNSVIYTVRISVPDRSPARVHPSYSYTREHLNLEILQDHVYHITGNSGRHQIGLSRRTACTIEQ